MSPRRRALLAGLALAVVVGAWFGGLGPGLLATVLGAITADYFFLPPVGSLAKPDVAFLPLLLFTLQGLLISWLVEALLTARRRAEASAQETRSYQESLRRSEEEDHVNEETGRCGQGGDGCVADAHNGVLL